jgi:hypothetical protein
MQITVCRISQWRSEARAYRFNLALTDRSRRLYRRAAHTRRAASDLVRSYGYTAVNRRIMPDRNCAARQVMLGCEHVIARWSTQ